MNKNELSAAIAAKAGLTRKDAEAALCAMSDIVAESLKNGEKVQIVGFGAFEVKERPARKARNPKTRAAGASLRRTACWKRCGRWASRGRKPSTSAIRMWMWKRHATRA